MIEVWRSLVGSAPAGSEVIEYAFVCIAALLVISLFFKFIFTLLKILFTLIKK